MENNSVHIPANDELLYKLSDFFKVFADSTRIKMLCALSEGEQCVIDLSQKLNMSQSAVSHQLQTLRAKSLVRYRRDGKTILYSLSDEGIISMINQGLSHVKE